MLVISTYILNDCIQFKRIKLNDKSQDVYEMEDYGASLIVWHMGTLLSAHQHHHDTTSISHESPYARALQSRGLANLFRPIK